MWKCGYRYLSCEKLHKICQLVPTLQIREQLVNICFFSAVSCSFLNASIHFLWTLNYAMTEYRVILLTANFSICFSAVSDSQLDHITQQFVTNLPHCGERSFDGYLRQMGLRIQRHRLRRSLHMVDSRSATNRFVKSSTSKGILCSYAQ